MANPILFFESLFTTGTLSSSGDAVGWPVANVADWREATGYRWQADTLTGPVWVRVDGVAGIRPELVALGGHTLGTAGARWRLQGSNDGFNVDIEDLTPIVTPTDNRPTLAVCSAGAPKIAYRILIDTASGDFAVAPQLGIVTAGRKLELTEGAQPNLDPYGEEPETDWVMNEAGSPIGSDVRYVRKRLTLDYSEIGLDTEDFFRPATGLGFERDFQPHARGLPFWFLWNVDADPEWIALCRRTSAVRTPFHRSTRRRDLVMTFEASVPAEYA